MLILNIETSTTVCSVALAKDGVLIALKELNNGYTHAENLTIFIQDIFKEQNIKLNSINAVAVSKGPGSYTGLRIGVSVAKGLCYALNKPLIAVDTLQIISESESAKNASGLRCPMLDARRMEVYYALYDEAGKEISPATAAIIDGDFLKNELRDNKILFFGDGAAKCKEILAHQKNAEFIENVFPSAKNMISLSEKKFSENKFEDVAYFEPFYLKPFYSTAH